jgi:hypothetical protein
MCSGTDCASACDQGYCYAEEMQRRQQAEWEAEQEEAERHQARRCDSNLVVGQLGECLWCGAAQGQTCLDPPQGLALA